MQDSILTAILVATIVAGTPLIITALGELVTEKSGVLNLGAEGMMAVGAIAGFAAAHHSGSATVGTLAGMAAGALMALIFAVLTLTLLANQVASGLALSIFGVGLSAFIGKSPEFSHKLREEWNERDYHKPSDVAGKIDYEDLDRIVDFAASIVRKLEDATEVPT